MTRAVMRGQNAMGWTRNIRVRQLQMLERLCAVRNLSQVADEFSLTQPALSKWLKEFEASVGAPLFIRQARGVEPLPVALELARHARGIVARLDRAQTSVEHLRHLAKAHLAVGVSPMAALVVLPDIVRNFHQHMPGTFISVHEATLDTLVPKLRSGELDLVIGRIEDAITPAGFHHERLLQVSSCLVVCETHPLAGKAAVTWEEALQYPWIAPPATSPIRRQMRLAFEALGIDDPPVMVESSYVATTARLIPGTDFIAPMAGSLARVLGLVHTLNVPQPSLGLEASVGMLWRIEDEPSESLRQFLHCVRAVVTGGSQAG